MEKLHMGIDALSNLSWMHGGICEGKDKAKGKKRVLG